ncbi:MAG: hypothetical protein ONB12_06740 [candidate division KSB1 bacterium]|nr:hypothetical protein [candidate division KSB1 bacterium]
MNGPAILLLGVLLALRAEFANITLAFERAATIWASLSTLSGSDVRALPLNRGAVIFPDYTDIVIPPNIAPLNFMFQEKGERYQVRLIGGRSEWTVSSRSGKMQFSLGKWRRFLKKNRGTAVKVELFIRRDGKWFAYSPTEWRIAEEPIDEGLVYRIIDPAYHLWSEMGIYQRNLTNFDEKVIMTNRTVKNACLNCHSFCAGDPNKFMFHLRGGPGTSLILAVDGQYQTIDTRTELNSSPGAYRCWHPDGRYIAFSVNKVAQFFHAVGENRDVYDSASDLILYDIATNTVSTCPQIADPNEMETYPMWTPDGRTLYFCSAPQADFSDELNLPYDKILYSLKRISFDPNEETWGTVETVIDAGKFGKSITHPSVSPDGRFLLFSASGYGNFTIYKRDSDLYMMDLKSGEWGLLPVNSDQVDSYHSWSSNSRWFVFSSKRHNLVTARPYFVHVDEKGGVSKPFIMPQKDPEFYLNFIKTYNVPELVIKRVPYRPQKLTQAAYRKAEKAKAKSGIKSTERSAEPETTPWPWQPTQ